MTNALRRPLLLSVIACAALAVFAAQAGAGEAKKAKIAEEMKEQPKAAAPVATKPGENFVEKVKGVEFKMIWCPPGSFMMGSPKTEKGHKKPESPQHKVELDGFWISATEVTWELFDEYYLDSKFYQAPKGEGPPKKHPDWITRSSPPYKPPEGEWGKDGRPAIRITHYAAEHFCKYLTHVTGRRFRLPTEAEWEYACRAGTTTAYCWGDDPEDGEEYCWTFDNCEDEEATEPVATKKPNAWGIYDMHGNVCEWTADYYSSKYYSTNGADKWPKNPTGPVPDGPLDPRSDGYVVRGGQWNQELVDKRKNRRTGKTTTYLPHRAAARARGTKWWRDLDPMDPKSLWWLPSGEVVGIRLVCDGPVKPEK